MNNMNLHFRQPLLLQAYFHPIPIFNLVLVLEMNQIKVCLSSKDRLPSETSKCTGFSQEELSSVVSQVLEFFFNA